MARDFQARSALVAYLKGIMRRTNGTFTLRDAYVSGSDDHVLAAQQFGAAVEGRSGASKSARPRPFGTGQIERWFHIRDQRAYDEFFARFE